jgi:hypothetical protein
MATTVEANVGSKLGSNKGSNVSSFLVLEYNQFGFRFL